MIKLSVNEALNIQRAQLVWYRQAIGRRGVEAIMAKTRLPNINPDEPVSIFIINDHIPRGGSIEGLRMTAPKTYDPTRMGWYNAIRRGLL